MKQIKTYRSGKLNTLIAVSLFTAIAYVLCVVFHFRVQFLSFELKDAILTLGAMMFGPLWGLAMVVVVSLIEFATISSTGVWGLVMNIISSGVFVCLGSLIYALKRTMKGAVAGMAVSVFGMTGAMMLANLLITPIYTGMTTEQVAALIPTLLLPFNLTKGLFNAAVVFLLYTPVSNAIRHVGFSTGTGKDIQKKNIRVTVIVSIIASLVAVAALVFLFVVLKGQFILHSEQ